MRKDWEVKKLGDICEIQNGYAFRSALFREQGLPILRISNIQNDAITLDNIVYFLESDYNIDLDRFKVYPGDTVIALSGATTGKIGVNKTDLTFYLNQRVALCRESNALIKGFLFYYLRTKTMELLSMAGGAAQPNLSTNQIQQLLISVPTLQIQQKIVEELDCLTSIIEKQKKQLEELDNLAQSIFYDMFGDPIENEKEWTKNELQEICIINPSKREINSLLFNGEEEVSFLPMEDLDLYALHFKPIKSRILSEIKTNYTYFAEGDIVMAKVTPCFENGKIGIAINLKNKIGFGSSELLIYRSKGNVLQIYLYFVLASESFHLFGYNNLNGVSGLRRLTKKASHSFMIPVPPLSLQQQFAAKIEVMEKQKELIKKSIKETEDLFNSRMDYYFN